MSFRSDIEQLWSDAVLHMLVLDVIHTVQVFFADSSTHVSGALMRVHGERLYKVQLQLRNATVHHRTSVASDAKGCM